MAERHHLDEADAAALRSDCYDLLQQHSKGDLPFTDLVSRAKQIANVYSPKLGSGIVLTAELVVGLVFAIAADEAANG